MEEGQDPDYDAFLNLSLFALAEQGLWVDETWKSLDRGDGYEWTQLQAVIVHAATLGDFLRDVNHRKLRERFPDAPQMLRYFTSAIYDFTDVQELRHVFLHLNDRLALRWEELREHPQRSELLTRTEGPLENARGLSIFNWDSERGILSAVKQSGGLFTSVDIRELARHCAHIWEEAADLLSWLDGGGRASLSDLGQWWNEDEEA